MTQYMPEGSQGNRFVFDATTSANTGPSENKDASESVIENTINGQTMSLAELLNCLGVDTDQPLLTILNGSVIQVDSFTTTQLADDDKLALMPPITAG